jgi:hypothetical protein
MTFKVGDRLTLTEYGRPKVIGLHCIPPSAIFTVTKTIGNMVIVTYDGGITTLAFGTPKLFLQLAEPEKLLSYEDLL